MTPEQRAAIVRRDNDWATADWDEFPREHPATECTADRDRHALLAALDAANQREAVLRAALEGLVWRRNQGPCWCISLMGWHEGWIHSPACLAARAALVGAPE